jgi:phosphoribosylformimino-5-aminoimidazole carboxamide ribotide isomerase
MLVMPAIDLRAGACVQLVGGSYDREQIRLDDPVGVAREWSRLGFTRLHVVDLDAATGRGSNARVVRDILNERVLETQVGGGVRSADQIERLFHEGADGVVLGTRALEEPGWLADVVEQFPGELIVAADVRERRVVTRGWERTLARHVLDVVEELNDLPLAGIMVTAVHKEGQLRGTDLPLMEDVAELSHVPVIASGGVTTLNDLRALADRGVAGAVVGMALYTGVLDARHVAAEFSAWGSDEA